MIRTTVAYRGLAPSEALQNEIKLQVRRLDQAESNVVRCHVNVERREGEPVDGYQADVHLTMRGGDTVVSYGAQDESLREDVHEALRRAFGDVAGQLTATRLLRYQPRHRERGAPSGW